MLFGLLLNGLRLADDHVVDVILVTEQPRDRNGLMCADDALRAAFATSFCQRYYTRLHYGAWMLAKVREIRDRTTIYDGSMTKRADRLKAALEHAGIDLAALNSDSTRLILHSRTRFDHMVHVDGPIASKIITNL